MKAVVVDDEPLARTYLSLQLKRLNVDVVAAAGGAEEALTQLKLTSPDVLFADINMPGLTGMDLADRVCQLDAPPALVFVTAYDQHAVEAYEKGSTDYLMKPVSEERLAITINRIREQLPKPTAMEAEGARMRLYSPLAAVGGGCSNPANRRLPVREDYTIRLIPYSDILLISARDKRVYIHTKEQEIKSCYTLKELEARLPKDEFFRVHDGHIVRLESIQELHSLGGHGYAITLTGGMVVPLSRLRYRELQQLLGT